MTLYAAVERPACERPHGPRWPRVPAETWSPVFGQWLCRGCLDMLSATEAQRCPGAYLDHRERRETDD